MTEFISSAESIYTPEIPRRLALVTLPEVTVDDTRIRLAMHTDNMQKVMLVLGKLDPEIVKKLKIEGRVINPEQFEALSEHPLYQFFMNGRVHRARVGNQRDVLVYTAPSSLNISNEQARELIGLTFSPRNLSDEIGFEVGYFNVDFLLFRQSQGELRTTMGGELTPILGGVNEFRIGSDELSRDELDNIASIIQAGLTEEQQQVLNTNVPSNILGSAKGYTTFTLTNTFNNDKEFIFIYSPKKDLEKNLENKIINEILFEPPLKKFVNDKYQDFFEPLWKGITKKL